VLIFSWKAAVDRDGATLLPPVKSVKGNSGLATYPPSSNHQIILIEYAGLTGRDGALGGV